MNINPKALKAFSIHPVVGSSPVLAEAIDDPVHNVSLMSGLALTDYETMSNPVFKGKGGKDRRTYWLTMIWDTIVHADPDGCARDNTPAVKPPAHIVERDRDLDKLVEAGLIVPAEKPRHFRPKKFIPGPNAGEYVL